MEHDSDRTRWLQTSVLLTDSAGAERFCSTILGPRMREAVDQAILDGWFFVRKSPWWRLRYRPARQTPCTVRQLVADILTGPDAAKHIGSVIHQVYEPETAAFGGGAAMEIAHQLFSTDSDRIADYLAIITRAELPDPRRELSLLFTAALARAAGQEWYEQGDIWAHTAALRGCGTALASRPDAPALAVRRFLTADPETAVARLDSPLNDLALSWLDAIRDAGTALRDLADQGRLERGLRAVIAHHVIFHWNRLGLSFAEQQRLARAARDATFADPHLINIGQASPQTTGSVTT